MPKFLRSDMLRPLDVVLLRSRGLESKGIKTVTGGGLFSRRARDQPHDSFRIN